MEENKTLKSKTFISDEEWHKKKMPLPTFYNTVVDIDMIIAQIDRNLENIAHSVVLHEIEKEDDTLIRRHKEKFLEALDAPEQHQPNWHQWGIITHTRKFMQMYDNEVSAYLQLWEKEAAIEAHLSETIDDIPKGKLIYLGILLHDIGKFRKNYSKVLNMRVVYTFNRHEVYSQQIIQNDLYVLLHDLYGLTDRQIEYVAMCARYHFELGFIREIGKKSKHGYSAAFANSDTFKEAVYSALPSFEEYKIEVGVLFLADSCAKTDVAFEGRSDREIREELSTRKLNPKLIQAVKQKPVNIEVAKCYLETMLSTIT